MSRKNQLRNEGVEGRSAARMGRGSVGRPKKQQKKKGQGDKKRKQNTVGIETGAAPAVNDGIMAEPTSPKSPDEGMPGDARIRFPASRYSFSPVSLDEWGHFKKSSSTTCDPISRGQPFTFTRMIVDTQCLASAFTQMRCPSCAELSIQVAEKPDPQHKAVPELIIYCSNAACLSA
eukprot:jgi/Mesvir1/18105/Mv09402-RA.1